MITSKLLVLSLLASPLIYTGCKNDSQDAQVQASADHLKEVEAQLQNLRADNDKLRQENETLKVAMARLEGKASARQAAAARPEVRKAPNAPSNDQRTPVEREKQAMRQGAIGGDSFK